MASDVDWKEVLLGEVIELKRGYDLPKNKRIPGFVPIVSSSGVSDFHAEAMVKGPGVVTGRYGTIGEVFYVSEDYWPLNTTLYVRDFKGNDPRFISYFLKTLDFQAYSDKGAVPGLNRNHLHLAKVRVPGESTQRSIARVLSCLDSKIDLNRRINQTLEAMAQAIFKSWFVDFDPVKAKIAARQTLTPTLSQREREQIVLRAAMSAISGKSDAELETLPPEQYAQLAATAALFPDEMEDSELGEIPRGWSVRRLPDIIDFLEGPGIRNWQYNIKYPPS
jgi:type I restriction enzyme S subunit